MELYKNVKVYDCPCEFALDKIGGKWKILIIWFLSEKSVLRYGELKRTLPKVTHKMLSQQLKELERDGIIIRTDYNEVPPRVEYTLTEKGYTARPIIDALLDWGKSFMNVSSVNL